jgi:hypothetical protein
MMRNDTSPSACRIVAARHADGEHSKQAQSEGTGGSKYASCHEDARLTCACS